MSVPKSCCLSPKSTIDKTQDKKQNQNLLKVKVYSSLFPPGCVDTSRCLLYRFSWFAVWTAASSEGNVHRPSTVCILFGWSVRLFQSCLRFCGVVCRLQIRLSCLADFAGNRRESERCIYKHKATPWLRPGLGLSGKLKSFSQKQPENALDSFHWSSSLV